MLKSLRNKMSFRLGLVSLWLLMLGLPGLSGPLALATTQPVRDVATTTANQNVLPGQVVVRLKAGLQLPSSGDLTNVPASLNGLFRQLGVSKWKSMGGQTNIYLLLLSSGVDDAIAALQNSTDVQAAEANYILKYDDAPTNSVPNDPLYLPKQWHLDKIQAQQAWAITTGSRKVIVAIVDSGIDETHPDLAGKVIKRYDFLNDQSIVVDEVGHGTAVASFITSNTNDGVGLAGLNWNVSLLNLKAGGEQLFSFDVARAIIFATDNGAQVINGSFGGGTATMVQNVAIEYAVNHNVVLVFSAGNGGSSVPEFPARNPGVIAVGATNQADEVTAFSSYGPHVSLSAPGAGVWGAAPGGSYVAINGTSFSSPIVAGVAALMLSVNPNLTPLDVKNILEGTADDISGRGFTPQTGWGRVNAYKAVLAAQKGDLRPNKSGLIKGKVSGIDPTKVSLSLDPFLSNGLFKSTPVQPDAQGNFQISGLGHATYQLRAAVKGVGTAQGAIEVSLNGHADNVQTVNFAFQNLKVAAYAPDQYVDQARFFDALTMSKAASIVQQGGLYFGETGHTVGGTFQSYWQKQGGVAVFGFPISEPFQELSATDGRIHTVQYFERNRFELHPEFVGTSSEVLLGLLGSEETANRKGETAFAAVAASQLTGNAQYFQPTAHSLDGKFLNYWQHNGGVSIFGYPISEPMVENGLLVQYFERNRFELHPENAGTNYEILLGLLGHNLAAQHSYVAQ